MKKKKIDEHFVKVYAEYCDTYAEPTRKKLLEIAPAVYKSKPIVKLLNVWNNARMKYKFAEFDECEYILYLVLEDKLKDATEHGPEK